MSSSSIKLSWSFNAIVVSSSSAFKAAAPSATSSSFISNLSGSFSGNMASSDEFGSSNGSLLTSLYGTSIKSSSTCAFPFLRTSVLSGAFGTLGSSTSPDNTSIGPSTGIFCSRGFLLASSISSEPLR